MESPANIPTLKQRTRNGNKALIQLNDEFEEIKTDIKTDLEESLIKCQLCNMNFIFQSALKKHMQSHETMPSDFEVSESAFNFICSCCKKQFFNQDALERHEVLHNNSDGTYTCLKCRDICSSQEDLIDHTIEHQNDEEEDACCVECGNILTSKKMLDIHMRIHFGSMPFLCTYDNCSKKFQTASTLDSHQKKDHDFELPYQCPHCLDCFRVSKKFKEHKLFVHEISEEPVTTSLNHYKCSYKQCQETFTDLMKFQRHFSNDHDAGFKCILCFKVYTSQRILTTHLQIHEGRKYECSDCDLKFVRASERNRHLYTHGVIKKHQCDQCSSSFMQHYMLVEHIQVNHQGKRYFCDFCGKVYKTRYTFMLHVQEHNGTRPKIQCGYCNDSFSSKSEVQRHVDVKHAIDFLECPECQVWCKNRVQLSIHMRRHRKESTYGCQICDKNYSSEESLQRHLQSHQSVSDFSCNLCGLEYLSYESLKVHKQTHEKKKALKCFKCIMTFQTQLEFESHQQEHWAIEMNNKPKKTNYKDKPLTCEVCGKWTRGKWWYDVHMRTHTNERPYKCTMCNHAAKTNASLKKHLQIHSETNDPNVPDFPCPDCNKTFREKKTLQIHSFVHSGHRPISCAICGKTFVTNYTHKKHLFKHVQNNETVENFPDDQRNLIASQEIVRCRNMVIKKRNKLNTKKVAKPIEPPKRVTELEAVYEDYEVQEMQESQDMQTIEEIDDFEYFSEDGGQADLDRAEEEYYEDLVVEERFEDDQLVIEEPEHILPYYQDDTQYLVVQNVHHTTKSNPQFANDELVYQITELGRVKNELQYKFEVTDMEDPVEEQEADPMRYYEDVEMLETEVESNTLPIQILSQNESSEETMDGDVAFVMIDPQNELERLKIPESTDIKVKSRFLRLSTKDDKKCIYCKAKIEDEYEMQMHLEQHYSERPYACKVCKFRFKQKSKLQRHEKVHLGTKDSQCTICHTTFTRMESLKKHMQLHNGILMYKCESCQKSFSSLNGKKSHEYMCEKRKQEEQTVEMIDYSSLEELKAIDEIYLINETSDETLEPNQCGTCLKKFNLRQSLEEHLKIHKLQKLTCDQCNVHFENKGLIAAHIRLVHDESKRTPEATYKKIDKNEAIQCQLCDKVVKQKYMAYHLSSKHPACKHRCPECKTAFSEFHSLKKHVLNMHSERNIQCSICPKTFATQISMKTHEKTHDEEKIPCVFCGLELNKSSMERHRQRHLANKPFNCKFCSEGFVARSEYRVHLMTNHRNDIESFDV